MEHATVAGRSRSTERDRLDRSFGALLGRALEETGVSQSELARHLMVEPSRVSDWRNGKRPMQARELLGAPQAIRDWFGQVLRSRDMVGIVDHPSLLAQAVRDLGEVISEYAADLADGQLDAAERIRLLQDIRKAHAILNHLEVICLDGEGIQ